jgi:hypothetical protein
VSPVKERSELRRVEEDLAAARARRDAIMQEVTAEIRELDRRARELRGEPLGNDKSDPVKNAGRKNVEALRRYMRRRKTTTQAAASQALGMNSGTAVWAFRALQEEGFLIDTGKRIGNSRVWQRA